MTQTAQGLFLATGKKKKRTAQRLLDGSLIKTDVTYRAVDDFTPTPPEPTRALMFYERNHLRNFPHIWEPACGDGRMALDIARAAYAPIVLSSDKIDRGFGAMIKDFFDFEKPLANCIITNPPYDEVNSRDGDGRWIWHALDVLKVEYMALLLSWSWPGAGGHGKLWAEHEPARVYLMRWKIDFTGGGSPPMLNGWFIWDRKHRGRCELLMMDREDDRQANLFEARG